MHYETSTINSWHVYFINLLEYLYLQHPINFRLYSPHNVFLIK